MHQKKDKENKKEKYKKGLTKVTTMPNFDWGK